MAVNATKRVQLRRTLEEKWTIEEQPLTFELNDDLSKEIAKSIQEEIDFHVLCDFIVEAGGVKITLPPSISVDQYDKIKTWVDENAKGKFHRYRLTWVFELPADATWFLLNWS
jgi:hypothetical protein